MPDGFGVISVVPPLLAIVLAIASRRPVPALFVGVWSGGVIYTFADSVDRVAAVTGGVVGLDAVLGAVVAAVWGFTQAVQWIVESIGADTFHAQILLFTILLGSGVALIWQLGGSIAVRRAVSDRLDTQRKVGLTAWALGILMFFDDYANTAIVGSVMKDLSDQLRISREKLSYIVDSTAAPVATLGLSNWVAFQIGMVQEGYEIAGIAADAPSAFVTYVGSIPYNVYSIFAILMVALIVLTGRDFGEMLDAEHRSFRTGRVSREGATPMQAIESELGEPSSDDPMLRSFAIPVVALVAVAITGALLTGYAPGASTLDVLGEADWGAALLWGAFAMVFAALAVGFYYRIFSLRSGIEGVIDGFSIMLTAVTILVLAWAISTAAEVLGTGEYVAGIAQGVVSPALLPVVVLFTAAFISFSMGSSWATMGVLTPIAISVAWQLTGSYEAMPVIVGAVFSGAIFGDHTSPISDTTVLSATFTGADLIDHVRTQIYYAGTVGLVAAVCFLLYGYLGLSPVIFLPIGLLLLVGLVYGLSELDARRKGVSPTASAGERAPPSDD
ncbi:Na+/H+ antiporter NhaC family protein [Halalkalicoccus sp. NIPERK01]|uniref:Na+/H+ antiporter NhaC family protein n=1 Tax=Halalkalicoccus sp. NIPERK01 TaxID=3053469 RepID=UPI00256EBC0E|nr:Na+/H+ antiporter NhaC family protein [Halalkalicoccus sp. NIPERK01]MDL5361159.1 Na+/H+ antiporter NhaC family protein [Halalkalicoccus sp. NIPERK01]